MNNNLVLLIHIFCCFFMTGLIWLIQLIHYPTFKFIPNIMFQSFHEFHSRMITYIVGPIMAIELGTGLFILKAQNLSLLSGLNALGLVIIWLSTAFLSVPTHNNLANERTDKSIQFLVATNWIRTALWTARSALFLFIVWENIKSQELIF